MLADEKLQGVPFLVFADKQDLPNALSVDEVKDRLALNEIDDRDWKILGSGAVTGMGLWEGLITIIEELVQNSPVTEHYWVQNCFN